MSERAAFREAGGITEKEPLVSVIIPVYNVGSYLVQCLESVINQSYRHLEIIVIDDGSTDGSGSICDRFAACDDRIRVIHTENKGLSSARNLGLETFSGSYLLFVDSDDWIEAHAVETLTGAAKKYNADVVVAKKIQECVGKTVRPAKGNDDVQVFRGDRILSAYGNGLLSDVVWNKLYAARCLSGVRFPDGHNYEDISVTWKIMTRLAKTNGAVAVLPEPLFHFRIRRSSITHTKSCRNIMDGWTAFHERYKRMPEYPKRFLPPCLMQTGQMWMNYYGFSGEEKAAAAGVVSEMRSFSAEHFCQVMKGSYPIAVKAICLVSRSSSPLLMWSCFWAGRLLRVIRDSRRKPYA